MTQIETILSDIRPEFDFTASDDFIADGMLDSLDVLTLVSNLNNTFSISIKGADIIPEHFRNLAAIQELVGKYR